MIVSSPSSVLLELIQSAVEIILINFLIVLISVVVFAIKILQLRS